MEERQVAILEPLPQRWAPLGAASCSQESGDSESEPGRVNEGNEEQESDRRKESGRVKREKEDERSVDAAASDSDHERPDVVGSEPAGLEEEGRRACGGDDEERVRVLEEERARLETALLALASRFAQLQFRLRQAARAPHAQHDRLMRDLEEFAFRACPDATAARSLRMNECEEQLENKRQQQQELIVQLKAQLDELEKFAYQEGACDTLPQSELMARQKLVIDEMIHKLGLNLQGDLGHVTPEELRQQVDAAITRIVTPGKVKEQVVEQLKTQIRDLEMFIDFLQDEVGSPTVLGAQPGSKWGNAGINNGHQAESNASVSSVSLRLLRRALAVLQVFAVSQFGCGAISGLATAGDSSPASTGVRGDAPKDYSPLLACLEAAVSKVRCHAMVRRPNSSSGSDTDVFLDEPQGDGNGSSSVARASQNELTKVVRRELAPALRDLMAHGLQRAPTIASSATSTSSGSSLVPATLAACFAFRSLGGGSSTPERGKPGMHPWLIFLEYYRIKNGKAYIESPAHKLSEAFGIPVEGGGKPGVTVTSPHGHIPTGKQSLLTAIHEVLSEHGPYKRGADVEFKALVCRGLNEGRLGSWLALVCRSGTIVEARYQPWAYISRTGFEGALTIISRLADLHFHLPVDLAVQQLKNIQDAF
uniref:RUN domain-containing protein 1 isoform X2 n=1 Tax=Myxine glutinosa TaxID=7769 RepID=UPI00358F4B52